MPHEYPGELPMCAFTTGLFNMLNFPAGVVPTGVVTQEDDEVLESEESFPVGMVYVFCFSRCWKRLKWGGNCECNLCWCFYKCYFLHLSSWPHSSCRRRIACSYRKKESCRILKDLGKSNLCKMFQDALSEISTENKWIAKMCVCTVLW